MCRIEKEKAQAKAEADDLRGQLDHASKGKVCTLTEKNLSLNFNTVISVFPAPLFVRQISTKPAFNRL